MIKAIGLRKSVANYGGRLDILNGIDLEIKTGESVAVVGASGSGKSTLLGLLAGLDEPSAGEIFLDDVEITALDEDGRAAVRARSVGFVFQTFQLLPGLTAVENVMLPRELQGDRGAREVALDYLARVGLGDRVGHYPRHLSGGEQQRVAIARAFASAPKVLFADEPTGNLDVKTGETIIELLFDLNKETNTTLVLVTHDLALASRCDRLLELEDGLIHEPDSKIRFTRSIQ